MAANNTNTTLSLYYNKGWTKTFTFKLNGTAVNIADYTCKFTIKAANTDEDSEAYLCLDGAVADAANGIFSIVAEDDDMQIQTGTHYWDFQIFDPDGFFVTLVNGRVLISYPTYWGTDPTT